MGSLWENYADRPLFDEFCGEGRADVVVVGGGMAGILTAYRLSKSGVAVAVVEANRILGGTTANTSAKITLQHGLIYNKLIKKYGVEYAKGYLEANLCALGDYRNLAQAIDCDYEKRDAVVYSTSDAGKIEAELEAYDRLGYFADFVPTLPIPINIIGGVRVRDQAQFNPLKLAFKLAENLRIYENTRVQGIERGVCITDRGRLRAEKIIVATHFPIINTHGFYFVKQYQHRSYVVALSGAAEVGGMYVDENRSGYSFRNYKDYLLVGGGAHRTGKRGGGYSELESFVEKSYTGAKIEYRFAAQDCLTLDGVPYIGEYSSRWDGIYVATGFNKWGMSGSMVSSSILADIILGNKNPYREIFDPSRSIMHPQLFLNIASSAIGLITPTAPRCSHLGCALKYNKSEHSWDCPCHGSRYSDCGDVKDSPAIKKIKRKNKQ